MKRFCIFIMTLAAMVMMTSFVPSDKVSEKVRNEGSLEKLWKRYEEAMEADRIQDMAGILEDVKSAALKGKASWDYFRACDEYVNVMSRRNWKLTDSLIASAAAEIHDYGMPSLEIMFSLRHGASSDSVLRTISAYEKELRRSLNMDIYKGSEIFSNPDAEDFNELMLESIENDYEFSLWALFFNRGYDCDEVYVLLSDFLGDEYPAAPYVRFLETMNSQKERKTGLEKLASAYAGRGIGMLAEDELLGAKFLEIDGKASSEGYRNLEREILEFQKRLGTLKGEEASAGELCSKAENVLDLLRVRNASVTIEDGVAEIAVRNLDKVGISIIEEGKQLFKTEINNYVRSFYKKDTLRMDLPVLNDGTYTLEVYDGAKKLLWMDYEKYTFSVASRFASDGMCIYAADYRTGEPVKTADLIFYDGYSGEKAAFEVPDFRFDGFTPLPQDIYPFREKKGYYMVCRHERDGEVHLSRRIYINNQDTQAEGRAYVSSEIMSDRAAYTPGDTIRFKAVLYQVRPDGSMEVLPAGETVRAELYNREVMASVELETNEFGSVSGSFIAGKDSRSGIHHIRLHYGDRILGLKILRIEEYVLPSYDLTFEKGDRVYFPGDTVTVKGKVRNYSGHGFGGLKASASISIGGRISGEKPVLIAPDGSFDISFKAGDKDQDYVSSSVTVRLTDITGETLEFVHNSSFSTGINLYAELLNADRGEFGAGASQYENNGFMSNEGLISRETAIIRCRATSGGIDMTEQLIDYELKSSGKTVRSGSVHSGDTLELEMSALAAGLYEFEMKTSAVGKTCRMLYLPADAAVPEGIDRVFRTDYENDEIHVQLGSGTGPIWAAVQVFGGKDRQVLRKELVNISGNSLADLDFRYQEEYPDEILLSVFWFRNGKRYDIEESFKRPLDTGHLPLEFVSFADGALPGQDILIRLRTDSSAEVLASVFDLSSENIQRNNWSEVRRTSYGPNIYISAENGCNGGQYNRLEGVRVTAYGTATKAAIAGSNAAMRDAVVTEEEEAIPFQLAQDSEVTRDRVRDDFSTTLAFEPFLRPSSEGIVDLKFRTSDKLSTFKVQVFAHDKSMGSSVAAREMVVSLPLQVSVMAPQYLYAGDRYVLNASLSNSSASAIRGLAYLGVGPVTVDSVSVNVPAGGVSAVGFDIDVPSDIDTLGLKVAVHDILISDGVFVQVPVYPSSQVLTEAHSAVVLGSQSVDEVVERLRDEFVNVSAAGASFEEISIMDMLCEALPSGFEAESDNAVSLSEALYVNMLAGSLRAEPAGGFGGVAEGGPSVEYLAKPISSLLKCANADGGFGWFAGSESSPLITAVVLERYAGLRDRGLLDMASASLGEDVLDNLDAAAVAAVKYLDSSYFGESDRPEWYGRLSLGQYLNVRSMFTGVEFDEEAARKAAGGRAYRRFRKDVRTYLGQEGMRTAGDVLAKVRTVRIINNLFDGSPEGHRIYRAWGLSSRAAVKKTVKARESVLESIRQYAVEHPSGGIYYPNAVMPWRGLLESEAYAHAQICDLFRDVEGTYYGGFGWDELADGIRIWLMVQKESQEWAADPGFVEALASVYDGSDEVLNTRVAVLSKKYSKPFEEIKAAGNGFRVSVEYYKEVASEAGADGGAGIEGRDSGVGVKRVRLAEGDALKVGDKVFAVYSLWSAENRSHVRLSVPRAACFRPADQLSGYAGGWIRRPAYGVPGSLKSVSPYAYREVRADRTLWWIDVFPEEDTVIEEELFVTQEGSFTAPVAEIESLYAPHYRANDAFRAMFNALF